MNTLEIVLDPEVGVEQFLESKFISLPDSWREESKAEILKHAGSMGEEVARSIQSRFEFLHDMLDHLSWILQDLAQTQIQCDETDLDHFKAWIHLSQSLCLKGFDFLLLTLDFCF